MGRVLGGGDVRSQVGFRCTLLSPASSCGFFPLNSAASFSYLVTFVSSQVAGRGETKSVANGEFSQGATKGRLSTAKLQV